MSTRRLKIEKAPAPTARDKGRRLCWRCVEVTLFRLSPTPLHAWRRFLLRCFGASVAPAVHIYPSARIWAPWNVTLAHGSCLGPNAICYSVGKVFVGRGAVVSQHAHLCAATHDHRDANFALMVGEIRVGERAWIAADAFIGPGVLIGDGAVVGARGVVTRDVEPGMVVAGNPARAVGQRSVT